RDFDFGGFSGSAEGDQDLGYIHGKLRAAYLFDMGHWYAKPIVDLDATWISYGDVSEDGGEGAGLDVSSQEDTVLSATPMLEIGGQWEMANGALVRPYAQAGVAFYGDTSLQIDSQFLDAPGGTPGFMTETEMDNVLADISVGLDVLAVENLNVRLSYDGMFGENTQSNAGTLRLEWRL
ncbi:MAG: autotransporter domain-containing protein, partial [Aestuariivirga sp.]|uniref:autotransporter outer membrane beta-barrel domain-containing protein n=1 Tax=Aestuariivirga sp. TaxID=2650926 RepID=UPI0038CFE4A5